MSEDGTPRSRSTPARRAAWVALLVVVVGTLIVGSGAVGRPSRDDEIFSIANTIRCPQCSGQAASTSEAPASVAIRTDIAARLAKGQSGDQIRDYYASRYGESILLNPGRSGAASLVWILPVVALVAAFTGLGFAFGRWRRQPAMAATADDRELVATARISVTDPHGEGDGR